MIRPKLQYAEVTRFPYRKEHVLKLERIQRIATKMVTELKHLTYEERLKEMHLQEMHLKREEKGEN